MRATRLAGLTRFVRSADLSKFLPSLGSEKDARMPVLAQLSLISTCFSIMFLGRWDVIAPVCVLHGNRVIDAIFPGDED